MQILVLNSGSSSLKFKLIEMPAERTTVQGIVERIGEADARLICKSEEGPNQSRAVSCPDHISALRQVRTSVAQVLNHPSRVALIGHRLVHGGHLFSGPVRVDDASLRRMEALKDLAPLHMPPALAVLRACRELMPGVPQVAGFDTTFYFSMPAKSYLYAVPREWTTDLGVRRFGFHGISHQYVTLCAADMLNIPLDQLKLVSAHLGNGASITAFDRGSVLDTSMGFTPLEGLIMGTRAGYLDPAVLLHVQRRTGLSLDDMVDALNTRSGLAAIGGVGKDLRAIMAARADGNADADLAVSMYVHTLRKYIGAYIFALGGAHALVFTGGVGENASLVREMVLSGLEDMGLVLDAEANHALSGGRAGLVSAGRSRIKILVIPTDEERMIARQAYLLAGEAVHCS